MDHKRYKTSDDNQHIFTERSTPEVKVQNYFNHKKPKKRNSLQCCLVCKANWEFVAVFSICLIVWAGCLTVYVRCEMNKNQYISLNTTQNDDNITKVSGIHLNSEEYETTENNGKDTS